MDDGKHAPIDFAESDDAVLAIVAPLVLLLDDVALKAALGEVAQALLVIPFEHRSARYTLITYNVQWKLREAPAPRRAPLLTGQERGL